VVAWERAALPLSIEGRRELLTGNYVSADYFTTLGVTPAMGRLLSPERDEHVSAAEGPGRLDAGALADRDRSRLETVIGRIRPGATIEQARADVGRIGGELAETYPATNQGRAFRVYSFSHDRTTKGLLVGAS
jgi:hypothetical protein